MKTKCNTNSKSFKPLQGKKVEIRNDGGNITSFGGVLALREVANRMGLPGKIRNCLEDGRNQAMVTHKAEALFLQRMFAINLGEEDLNDHTVLRNDPLIKACATDQIDEAGASAPTLCRFENQVSARTIEKLSLLLVDLFIEKLKNNPRDLIVLDFDATGTLLYGEQENRFFNGHYDDYCYTPIYVVCDNDLVFAHLMPSSVAPVKHARAILGLLALRIRRTFPNLKIIYRGDAGFYSPEILYYCETNSIYYITGFNVGDHNTKNVQEMTRAARETASLLHDCTGNSERWFDEVQYTAGSWFTSEFDPAKKRNVRTWYTRRVIIKAEHNQLGSDLRFIVTNIEGDAQELYEKMYCARGDMENRIKETQLYLFAKRMSAHQFRTNSYRLLLSCFAYVLHEELQTKYLRDTELANSYVSTVREKFLLIGARVTVSHRRVVIHLTSNDPNTAFFLRICERFFTSESPPLNA